MNKKWKTCVKSVNNKKKDKKKEYTQYLSTQKNSHDLCIKQKTYSHIHRSYDNDLIYIYIK